MKVKKCDRNINKIAFFLNCSHTLNVYLTNSSIYNFLTCCTDYTLHHRLFSFIKHINKYMYYEKSVRDSFGNCLFWCFSLCLFYFTVLSPFSPKRPLYNSVSCHHAPPPAISYYSMRQFVANIIFIII